MTEREGRLITATVEMELSSSTKKIVLSNMPKDMG